MSNARAIRYRRLAQEDNATADLLLKLADECDRGLLCTAEWRSARPSHKSEQPPKAGDAKDRFKWDPLYEYDRRLKPGRLQRRGALHAEKHSSRCALRSDRPRWPTVDLNQGTDLDRIPSL